MATKTSTATAAAPDLLHPSLYTGVAVSPVTKAELRTILEHFAAGLGASTAPAAAATAPSNSN
jgi:hypothetical protein